MPGLFVTATCTDVGKTFVTAGLLRAARRAGVAVDAVKPVMSGYDQATVGESDAGILLAALDRSITLNTLAAMSPWRFSAPLSPDMAAAAEGRSLDFSAVTSTCRAALARDVVTLIEGVGGVMAPLDQRHTVLDLIAAVAIPVLLVTSSELGAISHCLTAVTALATRGLKPALIVLNETAGSSVPLAATAGTLRTHCTGLPLTIMPRSPPEASFDDLFALVARLTSFRRVESPA